MVIKTLQNALNQFDISTGCPVDNFVKDTSFLGFLDIEIKKRKSLNQIGYCQKALHLLNSFTFLLIRILIPSECIHILVCPITHDLLCNFAENNNLESYQDL